MYYVLTHSLIFNKKASFSCVSSHGIKAGQKLANSMVLSSVDLGGRKSISLEDAQ